MVRYASLEHKRVRIHLVEKESDKDKSANARSVANREKQLWRHNSRLPVTQQPLNKLRLESPWAYPWQKCGLWMLTQQQSLHSISKEWRGPYQLVMGKKKNNLQTTFYSVKTHKKLKWLSSPQTQCSQTMWPLSLKYTLTSSFVLDRN